MTNNKPTICVKFCNKLFKRRENETFSWFNLPYKIIFAAATIDSVLIYSTTSEIPIYIVGNLHYAILTDLAWKNDKILAASSSDGYCSFITFDEGELGENYQGGFFLII